MRDPIILCKTVTALSRKHAIFTGEVFSVVRMKEYFYSDRGSTALLKRRIIKTRQETKAGDQ